MYINRENISFCLVNDVLFVYLETSVNPLNINSINVKE